MKESDIKNAELALLITLNTSVKFLRPGRLKGLLERLSIVAQKEANLLPRPTKKALTEIKKALDTFEELTGWGRSEKHLLTYVNSILLIIEPRGYVKLNKILVDIADYKLRHKEAPMGCYWTAPEIEQKWHKSFYGGITK